MRLAFAAAAATFAIAMPSAHAQNEVIVPAEHEHQTAHWDPAWGDANAWDYTLAAVAATAFAVEGITLQGHQAPLRWTEPILFDEDVRSALRASSQDVRQGVDLASWALIVTQIAYPVVVDVPYAWSRYGRRVANDLFWQDAVTLFLAGALDFALRDLTGRARPNVYDCLSQGRTDCIQNPESVRSFPGGHTMTATAASVLTCTQHLYVHIYGGAWDGATCAATLASDVTVAFMRIIADSHWATDQIAALSIGALVGWGVPYLMHYRFHSNPAGGPDKRPVALVLPMIVPVDQGAGVGAVGLF